eukprot:scaffold35955_cov261-Skeletonema_dohrnii-CCMP3373.AAC.2
MNTTDRIARSNGQNPLPVAVRLQNYLSNTITLDGDRKKSMLTSRRHANLGMIYSATWTLAISDGGYNNTGTTTFDINAAAHVEDDDPMVDEAIEMMTLAIHAAEGKDDENAEAANVWESTQGVDATRSGST